MAKINDLMAVSSEAELRDVLDLLHEREGALIDKLDAPMKDSRDFRRGLGGLDSLHGDLDMQLIAARSIHRAMLSTAGDTAERLSTMIRALDMEKRRVEATLIVIEQVMELKACIAGLIGSMGAPQDWEAAANYLSLASNIPEDVIRGDFALAVVPSIEAPDPPWTTIQTTRKSLCGLFLREFNAATEQGDGEEVARFFKLFPVIGGGAEETGLEAYGQYICQGMAETVRSALGGAHKERGKQNDFFYANNLTRLFEHIVQIINRHSGLVERHYGVDKVVKVIERLQKEAGIQGGIILDMWNDERAVTRMMADIKSYPFYFLSKSMMPVQRGINFALRGNELDKDEFDLDVKNVEGLFGEMTTMLRSWSLYERFIASQCKGLLDQEEKLPLPKFLDQCNLHKKISEKVIEPYKLTATFLFRRSVGKAFEMDTAPSGLSLSKPYDGSPPFILQAVDDIIALSAKATELLNDGTRELFDEVLWPRIRLILTTSFQDAVYDVSEGESLDEGDVDGETTQQVSVRFEGGWSALTRPLKHIMTPRTYAALASLAANKLARVLEKRAWSYSGRLTALGGLRLESDFSGIISIIAQDDYALREPFAQLQEILAIANMEDDEWDELESGYDSSRQGRSRLLSDEDVAKARKIQVCQLDNALVRTIS
ncbi:COG4 transport protein-domain-containing protein [Fusarium oxysporum f. sp. albedinis]|nr:COG4 transport protein-domain-containing protein [Fusarium oxysporum f. sp. albedinis]